MGKLLLSITIILFASFSPSRAEHNGTFPRTFAFGVGTSAYQTEGAWDEDGKGENIWDNWIHGVPAHIKNNDNGDVACDSYHQYERDIALASAYMAARHYKFSISWSRIFPNGGIDDEINMKGVSHYQDVIDMIRDYGMVPVATLYHHDLPQRLQDIGGWLNTDMVQHFVNYARVAFQHFDKVKFWIIFDDPRSICRLGYGEGVHAPGIAHDGYGEYLCASVLVKAHAEVYHMYKEEFPNLTATISSAIDLPWSEPGSDSIADIEAAERRNMFEFGLYAHPIFNGNWPQVVIDRIGDRSRNENLTFSRLPEFTQVEIDYINGTFDFMAINMYYTHLVADMAEPEYGDPGYNKDMRAQIYVDPDWEIAPNGYPIVPWGARKSLNWLKNTFNDPRIYITANGVSDDGSTLEDDGRINFHRDYLTSILDAIYEGNVGVFAYSVKNLIDSFEWNEGYSQRFGFGQVNFTDPSRNITRKKSVKFFEQLCNSFRVPGATSTSTSTGTTNIISTTTTITTTAAPSTTPSSANKIVIHLILLILSTTFAFYLRY